MVTTEITDPAEEFWTEPGRDVTKYYIWGPKHIFHKQEDALTYIFNDLSSKYILYYCF